MLVALLDSARGDPLLQHVAHLSQSQLECEAAALDAYRRRPDAPDPATALFALHALYRYHLAGSGPSIAPAEAHAALAAGRVEEAVQLLLGAPPTAAVRSALAQAYRRLALVA